MRKLRKAIFSLVIFLSYVHKECKHPQVRNFIFMYRKLFTLLIVIAVPFLLVRCNTLPNSIEELIGNYESILSEGQNKLSEGQNKDPEKCKNPEGSIPLVNNQADLYAYYPFNGNADDATGNGHHASVFGATLTTDRFGNENSAYMFDGIDDYIIYDEMNDFPAGNVNRTISGWFKSTVTNPYTMMLFGFGAQKNTYNFQVGIGPEAIGSPIGQYRVNGWGDSFDWRTGVKVPSYLDGNWHHCAVTYDGTTTKIYFDGEFITQTTAFSYTTDPENMVLVIGREIDLAGWEWNGALDDVRIYSCVLSEEEIRMLVSEGY